MNLGVFTLCVVVLDFHHLVAATLAFVVALTNNFWWNRHWTFGDREGHAGFQAARFFTVSLLAFAIQASILQLLVTLAGLPEILAQALSIAAATPAQLHREQDVELRTPRPLRLAAAALAAALAVLLIAAAGAAADDDLKIQEDDSASPARLRADAGQGQEDHGQGPALVKRQKKLHPDLRPTAYTRKQGDWQVSWFSDGKENVQLVVTTTPAVSPSQWTGPQIAWKMARGYPGAFGRKVNALYVWLPLCASSSSCPSSIPGGPSA